MEDENTPAGLILCAGKNEEHIEVTRSTNSFGPKSNAFCRSAARPVPITYAPASLASCVTMDLTAPPAPCARTLCPGLKTTVLEQSLPGSEA
jgi:hypothetical protein